MGLSKWLKVMEKLVKYCGIGKKSQLNGEPALRVIAIIFRVFVYHSIVIEIF